MAKVTGGEVIVKCLMKEGVKRIFGITDAGYHPVMAAAVANGMRWVGPRHEAAGVHMAEGAYQDHGRDTGGHGGIRSRHRQHGLRPHLRARGRRAGGGYLLAGPLGHRLPLRLRGLPGREPVRLHEAGGEVERGSASVEQDPGDNPAGFPRGYGGKAWSGTRGHPLRHHLRRRRRLRTEVPGTSRVPVHGHGAAGGTDRGGRQAHRRGEEPHAHSGYGRTQLRGMGGFPGDGGTPQLPGLHLHVRQVRLEQRPLQLPPGAGGRCPDRPAGSGRGAGGGNAPGKPGPAIRHLLRRNRQAEADPGGHRPQERGDQPAHRHGHSGRRQGNPTGPVGQA